MKGIHTKMTGIHIIRVSGFGLWCSSLGAKCRVWRGFEALWGLRRSGCMGLWFTA